LSVDIPFETVSKWLKQTPGINVKSSMAHRRAGKLGDYVEDFNEQRESAPLGDEQEILVALADGKGVPCRQSFARPIW
jgi:hypothetical protein